MFRSLRTLGNHLLKQNKACHLSQVRATRNYPQNYKKPVIDRHELFLNERNLNFSTCFILGDLRPGTFYYSLTKEDRVTFLDIYQDGEANRNVIYHRVLGSGAKVRVQHNFDPTSPYDMRRIQQLTKKVGEAHPKFECIHYMDSTGESNMMNFFILCSAVLKDKGEAHMIMKKTDFDTLKLQDLAKSVSIFLKKKGPYPANYCSTYTPTHITPIEEAILYIFELDENRQPESGGSSEGNPCAGVNRWNLINEIFEPKPVNPVSSSVLDNNEKALVDLHSQVSSLTVKAGGRFVHGLVSMCQTKGIPLIPMRSAQLARVSPGHQLQMLFVTASMDLPHVTKYKALVSAQTHRRETIRDLYTTCTNLKRGVIHGGLIRELLISVKQATGDKPHRLIFYRDGVSEGQVSEVLLNEMDKIRKACVLLEENYMPPVTFIVVQKRNHTRLFPVRHGNMVASTDRSGDILPGTVVDTKICHPSEFDFYLCSHSGIQNKITADGLQMLTNSLCYTYARCTRSVSIVPPAYYAHIAAFRAQSYTEGDQSDSSSRGQHVTKDHVAEVLPLPIIHDNVKSVMFYC